MPHYIWALHDFSPEHEDELTFKAGDRIEIVEEDDLYGDGWWQGRTQDGRTGLFPHAYTTSTPPAQLAATPEIRPSGAPVLDSLQEESEEAPSSPGDNAVMAATMTDVQHAIDQLAVSRGGGDDTSHRTLSFIESGTDTDRDTGDEGDEEIKSPGGWKGTNRQRLAQNAQMVNMKAAAAMASKERPAPPIPVEMSDESDAGEDDSFSPINSPPGTARAAGFGPPQKDDVAPPTAGPTKQIFSINTPPRSTSSSKDVAELPPAELPPANPPRPRSPLRSGLSPSPAGAASPVPESRVVTTSSSKDSTESPVTPSPPGAFTHEPKLYDDPEDFLAPALLVVAATVETRPEEPKASTPPLKEAPVAAPEPKAADVGVPAPVQSPTIIAPNPSMMTPALAQPLPMSAPATPPILASPAPIHPSAQFSVSPIQPTPISSQFSTPWSAGTNGSFPPGSVLSGPIAKTPSQQGSLDVSHKTPPSRWTVDQVVEWLRSKGIDEGIVGKFIKNDITGDVLLELDVNMLKELDIPALGKRVRIANAINELKRTSSSASDISPSQPQMNGYPTASNYNTSFGSPFQNNTSFNAAPLSNGMMHAYLQQQQYAEASPTLSSGPFTPASFPGFGYSSSQAPSLHTRNVSISSSAPSGIAETPMDNVASTIDARLPLHTQLSHISEAADPGPSVPDRSPSESGAGSVRGAVLSVASSGFDPTPAATEEPPVRLRKGSLRSKPPMVTLTATDSTNKGGIAPWAAVEPEITLGSPPSIKIAVSEEGSIYDSTARGTSTELDDMTGNADRGAVSEGEVHPGLADLKRRMSTRKAVRASASSHYTTNSDSRADGASTPVSSIHGSPTPKVGPFGGTIGSRKKRHSEDVAGSGSRLSFFGGSLSKSRKPPPTEFSDTSPPILSAMEKHTKTLSRLYLGSQSRRSSRPPPPSIAEATAVTPVSAKSTPVSPTKLSVATPPRTPETSTLRKRLTSSPSTNKSKAPPSEIQSKPGMTALEQIGTPDHSGWIRKRGESFNAWKSRYFVLKGPHLYYVKALNESKIKGYINISGYKVVADENVHPGRYGFRIVHETEKPHYFSSVEQQVVREWMKALMKATIGRDYSRPVVSSCNIPTIPLSIAQAMNPAPRPPSPTARDATQRAMRRENTSQLSSRDALVLLGMPGEPDANDDDKARLHSFFEDEPRAAGPNGAEAPPRPSRNMRKAPNPPESGSDGETENTASDMELINWINKNLPSGAPPATDLSKSLTSGLTLFRLAENIKGLPTEVPDSAFPLNGEPEKLEGLFELFDFMLDNDVRIGSVSINDVRHGNKEKVIELVKSLKAWQERKVGSTR